jgi:hypothetical protein
MRFPTTCLAVTALAFMITGCAQHASTASSSDLAEIRYEVGPCYGTCPVYSVAVEAVPPTTPVNATPPWQVSAPRQAMQLPFVHCNSA